MTLFDLRVLVAGLGSMGKRRIRCLRKLGVRDVRGVDPRADRREEAARLYGIPVHSNVEEALTFDPQAMIVSVPPDIHHVYMTHALERGCHAFVEASVVDTGLAEAVTALRSRNGLVIAPSATLLFHPAIREIGKIVESGRLGQISNVILHSGQYLPDWHTYEAVADYYVSNRQTGGAREIVPFELSWLTKLFGFPGRVSGMVRKTIDIPGAEQIDDTYDALLDYGRFLMTVTVDVVSRHAVRRLLINGSEMQLLWDWNVPEVRIFPGAAGEWESVPYTAGAAESGYHASIGEQMYVDELHAFFEAIAGRPFVRDLAEDHRVLRVLYAIEESDRTSSHVRLDG